MQNSEREYLCGWCEMIKEEHHLHTSDILWLASLIVFAISILGTFTQDFTTHPLLKSVSIGGFVLFGLLWLYHLVVQIPSKMFQKVRQESSDLLTLRNTQKTALLQKSVAPQQYLNFVVRRITLHRPQKDTPYAVVELYLSNGTVFNLDFSLTCGKTKLSINNSGEHSLVTEPKVKETRPDKLNQGCLNNQIVLEQVLNLAQLDELWVEGKHTLARWVFEIKIQYNGEIGQSPQQVYYPDWEGEHYKTYEIS